MMDIIFVHVNGFFFTGKYKIKKFTVCQHVSSTYITVDTLYVSVVSPGCQQESKLQESL